MKKTLLFTFCLSYGVTHAQQELYDKNAASLNAQDGFFGNTNVGNQGGAGYLNLGFKTTDSDYYDPNYGYGQFGYQLYTYGWWNSSTNSYDGGVQNWSMNNGETTWYWGDNSNYVTMEHGAGYLSLANMGGTLLLDSTSGQISYNGDQFIKQSDLNNAGYLTLGTANSLYLTSAAASTLYTKKLDLPNFGTIGTQFDRTNGSATFGNNSYALGINNFSSGASRVGRDNGISLTNPSYAGNATTPIPANNFKNNAAFGSSIMGNIYSSWGSTSFKGTEKLEGNLTSGISRLGVSGGSQIFNSVALGNSSIVLQPSYTNQQPTTGATILGTSSANTIGNGRLNYTLVAGQSNLLLEHSLNNTNGTSIAAADCSVILGNSSLQVWNSSTSTNTSASYNTLSGKSKFLAMSDTSGEYNTAVGKSMIYSGNSGFTGTWFAPNQYGYFPGTDRWTNVWPRIATHYGFASGESIVANGTHGTALGKARVYADYGTAIGEGVDAGTAGTVVVGRYNKLQQYTYASGEENEMQQFVIGNGTGDLDSQRSNAFVVERSGKTKIVNKTATTAIVAVPATESVALETIGGVIIKGNLRLSGNIYVPAAVGDIPMFVP